jgi:hypothetical protein
MAAHAPDPPTGVVEFLFTSHYSLTLATWALVVVSVAMVVLIGLQVRYDPHGRHRITRAFHAVCRWCVALIRR